MRVQVGALATTYYQLDALLNLWSRYQARVPLLLGGGSRVILDLGHHWVDVDEDVRRYLAGNDPGGSAFFQSLFDEAMRPLADLEDAAAVARFLESIPGIGVERREGPGGDADRR
jgi:hypothetical protein